MKSITVKTAAATLLIFSLYACKKVQQPQPVITKQQSVQTNAFLKKLWDWVKGIFDVSVSAKVSFSTGTFSMITTTTSSNGTSTTTTKRDCNGDFGVCEYIVTASAGIIANPETGTIPEGFANGMFGRDANGNLVLAIAREDMGATTRYQADEAQTFNVGGEITLPENVISSLSLPEGYSIPTGAYPLIKHPSGDGYYVVFNQ
jgi:hypothetical protein